MNDRWCAGMEILVPVRRDRLTDTVVGMETVRAVVFGDWAAHKTLTSHPDIYLRWSVTHIPTGRCVMALRLDPDVAIRVAMTLAIHGPEFSSLHEVVDSVTQQIVLAIELVVPDAFDGRSFSFRELGGTLPRPEEGQRT